MLQSENELDYENSLLNGLRRSDRAIINQHLHEWSGTAGTVIYEKGDSVRYAYFPRRRSLVSHMVVLEDGRSSETALVGREGALGGIVSQGHVPAFARAEVRFGGDFYRVELKELEQAKSQSRTLNHLFARYADCMMAQIFQSVACGAMHSIEQRTARWLVSAMHRTGEDTFPLTQDELAGMIGVGRSYISRTLGGLKQRGIISLSRGRLTVEDPEALKSLQCECNEAIGQHYEDVLSGVYPDVGPGGGTGNRR